MCELTFRVNDISEKTKPGTRWELQFRLDGNCNEIENAIFDKNFEVLVGKERWSVSAKFSGKQKQFSKNNPWYIKGGKFEPKEQKRYKNSSRNTMHESKDFISAILNAYPEIKEKDYRGHFSISDNCMIIESNPYAIYSKGYGDRWRSPHTAALCIWEACLAFHSENDTPPTPEYIENLNLSFINKKGESEIVNPDNIRVEINSYKAFCKQFPDAKELKSLKKIPDNNPVFTAEEIKSAEQSVEDVENFITGFEGKERDVIAKARVNQGKFREILLNYWNNACAVSGLKEEKLLIASHILPWSKCETNHQKGDLFNGLLLSVVWDSLFDKGLISFDDNGRAILDKLYDETIECLGLNKEPYIIFPNKLTAEHKQYLNMHKMLHKF